MSERLQKNAKITLSILFIFVGIFLLSYNYLGSMKSNLFNEKNIELLNQDIPLQESVETIDDQSIESVSTTDDYIGYLEVPSLNIKRGFTSLNSKYNSLRYNVLLVDGSTMPDVKNGNLILAAHNGNSKIAYFHNLYKIQDGAHAYVTYNGKTYDYLYKEQYDVPKVGKITINRDANKTVLTLITCHHTDETKQVVYIFELQNVTEN